MDNELHALDGLRRRRRVCIIGHMGAGAAMRGLIRELSEKLELEREVRLLDSFMESRLRPAFRNVGRAARGLSTRFMDIDLPSTAEKPWLEQDHPAQIANRRHMRSRR